MSSFTADIFSPLKLAVVSVASVASAVLAFEFGAAELTAWSLILGALAVVISALGVVIVNIMKGIAELRTKTDVIAAKADVIEGHVNSAASRDASIIASQEIQMEMLRDTISKQEKTALLLAQAAAGGVASQGAAPVELKAIETNTKDTADALKDQP